MQTKLLRALGKAHFFTLLKFAYFLLRTAIGLKVKDGVVIAVENLIPSKLLVPDANRRIQTIDRHIGLVR